MQTVFQLKAGNKPDGLAGKHQLRKEKGSQGLDPPNPARLAGQKGPPGQVRAGLQGNQRLTPCTRWDARSSPSPRVSLPEPCPPLSHR